MRDGHCYFIDEDKRCTKNLPKSVPFQNLLLAPAVNGINPPLHHHGMCFIFSFLLSHLYVIAWEDAGPCANDSSPITYVSPV